MAFLHCGLANAYMYSTFTSFSQRGSRTLFKPPGSSSISTAITLVLPTVKPSFFKACSALSLSLTIRRNTPKSVVSARDNALILTFASLKMAVTSASLPSVFSINMDICSTNMCSTPNIVRL